MPLPDRHNATAEEFRELFNVPAGASYQDGFRRAILTHQAALARIAVLEADAPPLFEMERDEVAIRPGDSVLVRHLDGTVQVWSRVRVRRGRDGRLSIEDGSGG